MPEAPSRFTTDELISQRVNHLLFINRLTRRKAASELGISHSAFNTKINGGSSWKADELASLTDRFGVSFDFLIGRQPIEMAMPVADDADEPIGTAKVLSTAAGHLPEGTNDDGRPEPPAEKRSSPQRRDTGG